MGHTPEHLRSRVFTFRLPQPIADLADSRLRVTELCQRTVVATLCEVLSPEESKPIRAEFETWDREKLRRAKK